MSNVWRSLNPPNTTAFSASAEAWGGLTYDFRNDRLIAAGWYMSAGGANVFISVYDNLGSKSPSRPHSIILDAQGTSADWILDNVVDNEGNIYLAGYTTGSLGPPILGEGDAFIAKYSPNLTNPVFRQFGTNKADLIRKMHIDDRGELYAVGFTYGNYASPNQDQTGETADVIVQKFDRDLNLLEARQFGTPLEDRAFSSLFGDALLVGGTTEGSLVANNNGSFDGYAIALHKETLAVLHLDTLPIITSTHRPRILTNPYIYPNPTSNDNIIIVNPSTGQWHYEIYSYTGKKLQHRISFLHEQLINVRGYPSGLYLVKARQEGSNEISHLKFIKQ